MYKLLLMSLIVSFNVYSGYITTQDAFIDLEIQNQLLNHNLMFAVIENDIKKVKYLIDTGANINFQDNSGWTALHNAAFHCHKDIVELLIMHGADKDVKAKPRTWVNPAPGDIAIIEQIKEILDNYVTIIKR